jgi:hypothetical protein
MNTDFFTFKTHIEFSITSEIIELNQFIQDLGTPDRCLKKGEISISKHSGSIVTQRCNLWAVKSPDTEQQNDDTIHHHFEHLKSILLPKIDILKKYKNDVSCETSFWVWVETDDAGIGVNLQENELQFLYNLANFVHFSLICTNEIKKSD